MAAPAAITYGLRGAFSTSFQVTTSGAAAMDISNAQLIAGLTSAALGGVLITFLSTVFANAAAADTAFRAIGGFIDIRQTGGTASTSVWAVVWVAAAAVPALQITSVGTTDSQFEITVGCRQSAVY